MKKDRIMVRVAVVAVLGAALLSGYTANAEASWFCNEPYRDHRYEARHHHNRGWYHRGTRAYVIFGTPGVTIVNTLPRRSYNCGDGYHQSVRGGYSVVSAPQSIVVNVPNRNGSYTQVTLQVANNGTYVGPQGEVYPTQPTMEQLQTMYGQ